MSYKSRNEDIDEKLYETFEREGFEGEQANGHELDDELLCEPIDVFIMYLKDREKMIEFERILIAD